MSNTVSSQAQFQLARSRSGSSWTLRADDEHSNHILQSVLDLSVSNGSDRTGRVTFCVVLQPNATTPPITDRNCEQSNPSDHIAAASGHIAAASYHDIEGNPAFAQDLPGIIGIFWNYLRSISSSNQ